MVFWIQRYGIQCIRVKMRAAQLYFWAALVCMKRLLRYFIMYTFLPLMI